ncbi:hypothetical protein VCUG_01621 [Vavraia culicis subsp. floridensis]|uniref:Uncharacterized protein n=1 Tax=Vavraia culicis (isolate floridensis) TaxID=948595 RepID=L2GUG6_VAVCU|nr:uncharacterized protein VCUG_01621 [Vavraia culicis subsp. floridensis]ELA46923.1 hypothetical protein VCUG_01621 [Vavraia culicis subsp. floridensis]
MKNNIVSKIHSNIDRLNDTVHKMLPIDELLFPSQKYLEKNFLNISREVDTVLERVKEQMSQIVDKLERTKQELIARGSKIGVTIKFPRLENLMLDQLNVENERNRITVLEKVMMKKIHCYLKKIGDHYYDLYGRYSGYTNDECSTNNLKSLAKLHVETLNEVNSRCDLRRELRKKLLKHKIKNLENMKFFEMASTAKEIMEQEEKEEKLKIVLRRAIHRILDMLNRDSDILLPNDLEKLKDTYEKLLEEEKVQFDEIFDATEQEFKAICSIFFLKFDKLKRTRESIVLMKKIISDLTERKEHFVELKELIEKRDRVIVEIESFEKTARDPGRLKGSSIQLLHEERFRRKIIPSLLEIESRILEKLNDYKQRYNEPFMYGDEDYEENLRNEINGRIIHSSVYISNKTQSPWRKP